MRAASIYVVSVLALWFALRWATHMSRYELLEAAGVRTTGTIVSTTCGEHASFKYEYVANGQLFMRMGKHSEGGLSCAALTAGLRVPVAYLAESPQMSVAGDPAAALSEIRLFTTVASFIFPAIVLWLRHRVRVKPEVA
jgi:hypothetical protein